jgi:hypothetical protein
MKWKYNGEPFNEMLSEMFFGFVYLITDNVNNRKYIGKKQFMSNRKMTPKQLKERIDKRLSRNRTESDWREYNSSCIPLQKEIEKHGIDKFDFEILHLCQSKSMLTYIELKLQMENDVIFKQEYYNEVLGDRVLKSFKR